MPKPQLKRSTSSASPQVAVGARALCGEHDGGACMYVCICARVRVVRVHA
jgi:hypothetical protein